MTPRWWSVEVIDALGPLVTIAPGRAVGRENLQELDEQVIREAAQRMLAFIGDPVLGGKKP